jgi:di/tripeptidase
MFRELERQLGKGEGDGQNFLFYPSKHPIILQAHIDTVRKIEPEITIERNIIRGNNIIGADDRAGVYAAATVAWMLDKKKEARPSLLFTNHEEIGGGGMRKFLKKVNFKKLAKTTLLIAIDRQGANEFVYYNNVAEKVKNYMAAHGFIEGIGTFSDCLLFTNKTKIPSVNVSCGVYDQHTARERLHLDELDLTISRLMNICAEPLKELHPVKREERKKYTDYYYNGYYGNAGYWSNEKNEAYYDTCDICAANTKVYDITDDGLMLSACKNCIATYYRDKYPAPTHGGNIRLI